MNFKFKVGQEYDYSYGESVKRSGPKMRVVTIWDKHAAVEFIGYGNDSGDETYLVGPDGRSIGTTNSAGKNFSSFRLLPLEKYEFKVVYIGSGSPCMDDRWYDTLKYHDYVSRTASDKSIVVVRKNGDDNNIETMSLTEARKKFK